MGVNLTIDTWPESNNVEIVFDDLLDLKKLRNKILKQGLTGFSYVTEFTSVDPENPERLIKVKGSPNLQGIKTIMVGVRIL